MAYINPPWSEIVSTTRENRSAEHASLFGKTDPGKVKGKPSPVHPILPKDYKGIGKHPIMRSTRPKNW